jgi:putative ABC transport system permease protein
MTIPWRKALADLRGQGAHTVLVVLAIALGIAGFGSVLSTYAVLTRELNAGYLATNPASATFHTDRVDDALIAALRARGGVAEAEARRVVRGRVKVLSGDWRPLQLFVVSDYAKVRVSRLVPQEGAWPPAPGEVLIERDAFQVVKAQVGGTVTVKTAQGQERTLRVTGSVHDVGQAQARMEQTVYGYVGLDTLPLLGEEPFLDQLLIVAGGDSFDEDHVRKVAEDVRQWLEAGGHPVRRVDVPEPGKHPHADLTGLLLLAQSGFGLVALALSGILVVNLLTALMASERRHIGVMKAVGGTRLQIARLYLGQTLILGGAALLVGVPAGLVGARALCRAMAVFLNFDITSFAVPPWVFLLEALVGLMAPLLAGAWPVLRATSVPVREALADAGVSPQAFGRGAIDRALAGLRGPSRPVLLALRNGFRRRARMALTLATLAAGGLFFMSALNVRGSMIRTLDRMFGAMRFDLSATFQPPVPREAVERAVARTPGILAAEGWIATEAALDRADETPAPPTPAAPTHGHGAGALPAKRFTVVALPADSRFLAFQVEEGRGLRSDDANALVVNTRLRANEPALAPGAEVRLRLGHRPVTFRVVGTHREPFTPPTAYVSRGFLESLGGGTLDGVTNSVRLVVDPARLGPESLVSVKAALEEGLVREGLRPTAISSKGERRVGFDEHLKMIYVFLVVVSCVLGAVGGLGLATTMTLNVLERRRELGVLRAIGATPRALWAIVLAEAVLVVLSSWAAAAVAAWPISRALGDALVRSSFKTGLDFVVDWRGPLVWLAVSLALAVLASAVPAWRAGRLSVREALAHD